MISSYEVFVDAFGIPLEKFFLFSPGERAFCGGGFLQDEFAFLFEVEEDIFR